MDGVTLSAEWATVIDGVAKIFLHNRLSDKLAKILDFPVPSSQ